MFGKLRKHTNDIMDAKANTKSSLVNFPKAGFADT